MPSTCKVSPLQSFSAKITVATTVAAITAVWCAFPATASLTDDIEKANEVEDGENSELADLDATTADIYQVTEQLKALNRQVNISEAARKKLLAKQDQSEDDAEELEARIAETETEITKLEQDLAAKVVTSFQRQAPDSSALFSGADPSDSLRKRTLSNSATRSEAEIAKELRLERIELESSRLSQDQLETKREDDAEVNETTLIKFERSRDAVIELAQQAEERAERTLAEADAIGQLDEAEAKALRSGVEELQEQVRLALGPEVEKASEKAQANPASVEVPTGQVSQGDMRLVQGIWVHQEIVANVDAMLTAARADGIELSGGGFRDPASQIAVRKSNCGTSNYAIYQMPSSSCRPPTARPGSSMHEQGKAIDITYNGSIIKSRSSAAFVWLAANAEVYGLFNLPSEPWHWSVNGR